ncbi:hypothetical protein FPQ18DRAFT_126546 [Pyronema domesticum]|nr:hypothetical protein FPQ18DRAFT_126546 [Pyronema domesticum]
MRGFGISQAIGWVCSTGCALLYFGFHLSLALRYSNMLVGYIFVSGFHYCMFQRYHHLLKNIGCHHSLYSVFQTSYSWCCRSVFSQAVRISSRKLKQLSALMVITVGERCRD